MTEFIAALQDLCPGGAFVFTDVSVPALVTLQLVQGMSGDEFVAIGLGEPSHVILPARMT